MIMKYVSGFHANSMLLDNLIPQLNNRHIGIWSLVIFFVNVDSISIVITNVILIQSSFFKDMQFNSWQFKKNYITI